MVAPTFVVDPWVIREPRVDLEALPVSESIFTTSNGCVGMRGTLDEGEPHGTRGTFLSGVFETHPLAYPEKAYGDPPEGQVMIRVADGTPLRLVVDGVPLDVRTLGPETHERSLDLREGVLDRLLRWRTPSGTTMELRSRRLASLRERSLCAVRYEVRALDGPAHVAVRSELALGTNTPEVENADPRVGEALERPFETLDVGCDDAGGAMAARTRRSDITIAAAVRHVVVGAGHIHDEAGIDQLVTTMTADLEAGETLGIDKFIAQVWSRDGHADSLLESARAVLASGADRGWEGLVADQGSELQELWDRADVEVDGDPELQQALRYCVYTLFTSSACIADAPMGAKALTGLGYSGHTFWDIEGFVVPALLLLFPDAAGRLLRWRASTLDSARERAELLGVDGAAFAWRTIDGRETSAYWPAGTAAIHINADLSRAFWLHGNVTGDTAPELGALEILVETARLWMSVGHHDTDGAWHIFGVTGPDEYTGVVDDNVFTNLMARRNLVRAAEACERQPDRAAALGVDDEELGRWRDAAAAAHVPWDPGKRVHPANSNFTSYREWRFEDRTDAYPLQDHEHYAKLYRRQVVKQADLVQALWWCREDFTDEEVARDLAYYEARTVRDSSLSASVQAVVCAKAQHPDLAHRYLRESAMADLRDLRGDTDEGLHIASVAGTWLALSAGLGGLREDAEHLELAPLLPSGLSRTCYRVVWRGRLLRVETTRDGTTVTMLRGDEPVDVLVDGTLLRVGAESPAHAPLRAPAPLLREPTQPVGRPPLA